MADTSSQKKQQSDDKVPERPLDPSGNNDPTPPATKGEQTISGDMPDVASDDDTLANAQAVGTQTEEDAEHPQELDIARDIDKAEEYIRTH